MAYLKPATLTCPQCDFRSEVSWVIGVGPNSAPDKAPYRKLHKTGAFLRASEKSDTLTCPKCGGTVP